MSKSLTRLALLLVAVCVVAGCANWPDWVTPQPHDPFADKRGQRTPASVMADAQAVLTQIRSQESDFAGHLATAHAVLIFPETVRAGVGFAGQQGPGVLVSRDADGLWSGPIFQWYRNVSYGLQLGFQKSDMVLVVKTQAVFDQVMAEDLSLNLDALATFGRQAAGGHWNTMMVGDGLWLAYRSRGLFAGIAGGFGDVRYDPYWTGKYYDDLTIEAEAVLARDGAPSISRALAQSQVN